MTATTTTDTINLHGHVAEFIANTLERDPRTVAHLIAAELPDTVLRSALEQTLVVYVTQRFAEQMRTARHAATSAVTGTTSRWANASSAYKQALSATVAVGDNRKPFGECSSLDLRYLAQVREEAARATAKEALRFKMFDKALENHGAATVGELPEQVVLELMHWEPKP